MINRDFYTSNAYWVDQTPYGDEAGDEVEDLVLEFERGLGDIGATYIADFLWCHDEGDKVPSDLAENLKQAYSPLLIKLIDLGVPASIADGLLNSLGMIPAGLQCFLDNNKTTDGVFGVHLFMCAIERDEVRCVTTIAVELCIDLCDDGDDGAYLENMDSIMTLFKGRFYIHHPSN